MFVFICMQMKFTVSQCIELLVLIKPVGGSRRAYISIYTTSILYDAKWNENDSFHTFELQSHCTH